MLTDNFGAFGRLRGVRTAPPSQWIATSTYSLEWRTCTTTLKGTMGEFELFTMLKWFRARQVVQSPTWRVVHSEHHGQIERGRLLTPAAIPSPMSTRGAVEAEAVAI
jgi:hypothetical protein